MSMVFDVEFLACRVELSDGNQQQSSPGSVGTVLRSTWQLNHEAGIPGVDTS